METWGGESKDEPEMITQRHPWSCGEEDAFCHTMPSQELEERRIPWLLLLQLAGSVWMGTSHQVTVWAQLTLGLSAAEAQRVGESQSQPMAFLTGTGTSLPEFLAWGTSVF